jgi:hypothetical protein
MNVPRPQRAITSHERLRGSPRVVKRKMSNYLKRPEHRNSSKPTGRPDDITFVLAACPNGIGPNGVPTERYRPRLRDSGERADVKIDGLIHRASGLAALQAIASLARLGFLHSIDGGLNLPGAAER